MHRVCEIVLIFVITNLSLSAQNAGHKDQYTPTLQPNILLIVSEDNGPDLGCYGNSYVTTPNIDKLAQDGILFSNAYTTYSVCSPSRSTIFTGLYPHQNGQVGLATHKYHMFSGIPTFPAALKEVGYRTGCLGKVHVNPESQVPFDFHPYKLSNFKREDLWKYEVLADSFFRMNTQPFFLMVNFPDAHFPLISQAEGIPEHPLTVNDVNEALPYIGVNSRRLRKYTADYYNCINRLDVLIGNIISKLKESGQFENTLIVYLGDHGAQFSRGKTSCYESGVKVPLIVSGKGCEAKGVVANDLVSFIDLMPTFLEMGGSGGLSHLPGISLMPLLSGKKKSVNRKYLFTESDGSAPVFFYPQRSVRNKRYKLIHNLLPELENPHYEFYATHRNAHFDGGTEPEELANADDKVREAYELYRKPPEFELYDLRQDPYELNNLASVKKYSSVRRKLTDALQLWQESTKDPLADEQVLKMMKAEIDEIRNKYPSGSYTRDPGFSWKYPDYFLEYINRKRK